MNSLLAICDDPGLLRLIQTVFPTQNYQVYAADSAEKGVEILRKTLPTLVLVHLEADKGKSLAFCKFLRKSAKTRDLPLLLLADGPDDYLRKPFGLDELYAKIKKLTWDAESRAKGEIIDSSLLDFAIEDDTQREFTVQKSATGIEAFDNLTRGGLPKGSNVLVIGKVGASKSYFGRSFVKAGLQNHEPCLYVALDDNPFMIRQELTKMLGNPLDDYQSLFCMVDAYNWGGGHNESREEFVLRGNLNLTKLGGLVSDASESIGQDSDHKVGGRRVIDSVTSLMVNFKLQELQTFFFQITRTALAYGHISTIFTLEEGTLEERLLNNLIAMMDGVIEMERRDDGPYIRIRHMKWINYEHSWIKL